MPLRAAASLRLRYIPHEVSAGSLPNSQIQEDISLQTATQPDNPPLAIGVGSLPQARPGTSSTRRESNAAPFPFGSPYPCASGPLLHSHPRSPLWPFAFQPKSVWRTRTEPCTGPSTCTPERALILVTHNDAAHKSLPAWK